jgi:hypothetical protein
MSSYETGRETFFDAPLGFGDGMAAGVLVNGASTRGGNVVNGYMGSDISTSTEQGQGQG